MVDLAALVERIVAGMQASGEPAERFQTTVEGDLPEMWGDPDRLTQVFANLVENALRHGAGTVQIRLRSAGDGAVVEVSDEGPGVDPRDVPHLFTKFWKTGRRGGTGLGLFVARGLFEAHGGTIQVGPGTRGGARFTVHLPAGTPD